MMLKFVRLVNSFTSNQCWLHKQNRQIYSKQDQNLKELKERNKITATINIVRHRDSHAIGVWLVERVLVGPPYSGD